MTWIWSILETAKHTEEKQDEKTGNLFFQAIGLGFIVCMHSGFGECSTPGRSADQLCEFARLLGDTVGEMHRTDNSPGRALRSGE